MTLIEAINDGAAKLAAAGIDSARRDAELLLCHAAGRDRAWLLAHIRDGFDEKRHGAFKTAIERRAKREPVQYITGKQEFWGLDFHVGPDVLIPRPETELIIETALEKLTDRSASLRIIDLCTGSGCIAVSLAKELSMAHLFATDASEKALAVARENAELHGVSRSIDFAEGDLFEPLELLDIHGRVDMIVSNPPYVPSGDRPTLQPEVRDYEPAMALFAGPRGTEIHNRILDRAPKFLKERGVLIMEMGIGQTTALQAAAERTNAFKEIEIKKDLAGIERVIVAKKYKL